MRHRFAFSLLPALAMLGGAAALGERVGCHVAQAAPTEALHAAADDRLRVLLVELRWPKSTGGGCGPDSMRPEGSCMAAGWFLPRALVAALAQGFSGATGREVLFAAGDTTSFPFSDLVVRFATWTDAELWFIRSTTAPARMDTRVPSLVDRGGSEGAIVVRAQVERTWEPGVPPRDWFLVRGYLYHGSRRSDVSASIDAGAGVPDAKGLDAFLRFGARLGGIYSKTPAEDTASAGVPPPE